MAIELTSTTDLDYLILQLRVHLWDTEEPYTYSDESLRFALMTGFKLLMPRWNSRYLIEYDSTTDNWDVSRNPNTTFIHGSPPVIMYGDERPIILAAAVALKGGLIYLSAGGAQSWKDEEVSFSNISGAKMQEASLLRDWEELNKLVPERRQRLATAKKQELPGFKHPPNYYEGES